MSRCDALGTLWLEGKLPRLDTKWGATVELEDRFRLSHKRWMKLCEEV